MPDPTPTVTVPLDLLERMARETGRLADIVEGYHRDALPHLSRLREIEEARERARAAADAERLEGVGRWRAFFMGPVFLAFVGAVVGALTTYFLGVNGIAPQPVKDGMEVHDAAER